MFEIKYRIDSFAINELKKIKSLSEFNKKLNVIDGMFEIKINDYSEGWFCDDENAEGNENIRNWAYILSNLKKSLKKNQRSYFKLWEGECRFFCFELKENLITVSVCDYDSDNRDAFNFYNVKAENPIKDYTVVYKTEIEFHEFNEEIEAFLMSFRKKILDTNSNIPKEFDW